MPLLCQTAIAGGQAQLGLWRIDETADRLASMLSRPELYADSVASLRFGSRRHVEVLAVRCLLLAMTGEEQRVEHDADGRPWLAATDGNRATAAVSISHTDGYAAVVVGRGELGVDIERRGRRVERVTSRFLQADELALMDGDVTALHLAWSAKETAYKVLGRDYYDLQRLTRVDSIAAGADPTAGLLTLHVERRPPMAIRFSVADDYVLTWYVGERTANN